MMGTDKTILKNDKENILTKTKGRPEVNRDMARRLFLAKYSTKQIAQKLKCNVKTIRRIKKELVENGELKLDQISKDLPIVEADFDQECKTATGLSFFEWMKSGRKNFKYNFDFCQRVWIDIWDKPSLVQLKDVNDQLGDQLCLKFLSHFGEDTERIRTRKVQIRHLLRFLGRRDLCDRHLKISQSRDPKPKRDLPLIEMKEFPTKFNEFIESLEPELQFLVKFKIATQMRTGDQKEERGLAGLKKNSGKSYVIFNSVDDYKIKVFEKLKEYWDITQLSLELREKLFERYNQVNDGDFLFNDVAERVPNWGVMTKKAFGVKMTFHDMRKISITWYYALGIPLEIATMLNVGWKDLNTPKEHYLHLRQLMRKSDKIAYREQIPKWFKDGTEEYIE